MFSKKRSAHQAGIHKSSKKKRGKTVSVPAQKAILVPAGAFRMGGAYMRGAPGSFEKKYFDSVFGATPIPSAGGFTVSWNLIPQGTTKNTRIGNKCTVVNINAHGQLTLLTQAASSVVGDKVRWIVFVDKQANGAAPAAISDLLQTMPGATTDLNSFRNMDNVDRFVILKDKTYILNPQTQNAALGSGVTTRELKMNKKCQIPLEFSSTTGAIGEIRSNNVMSLLISLGNNLTNFAMTTRVKFSDF